ncbi:hypothetical protein B0H11DRAFT_1748974 [Mycena galericulata]|nr:hypothetical protein B0H11DRAFT_1748974 [Mycena galericulata]
MLPPGPIPALVPRRLVTTTEGRPLRDAGGPRPLLEAIIHGLIGYLNLFKAGWQHRDVSNSNLLLVKNFQVTDAPLHDEARRFQLEFCTGVITDGDQAVLWKESREVATHRSGTLPFISLALLDNKNRPHSALDDFESFVWVLLWEMMHKGQQLGFLETDDQTCLKELCVTSPDILLWSKAACRSRFLLEMEIDSFVPVAALVKTWFELALKSEKRLSTLLGGAKGDTTAFADHVEEIERLCLETGRKYVETGLAYLPLLDESWAVKEPSL